MRKIKNIPNVITISRIIGSIALFFTEPLSLAFFVIYLICGLSDMVDGYIARKFNCASQFGATFDSIADFLFICVAIFFIAPSISMKYYQICWIIGIALLRGVSLVIGFYKYKRLAFLHTYANKVTGFLLFCFPIFFYVCGINITVILLCTIATTSAIEEVLISITAKELNRNRHSIFRE